MLRRLLGLPLVWGASSVLADSPAPEMPDTSQWLCRFCTYNYGLNGQVDGGLIGVDSSSYWFGRYTGLYHRGMYLLLDGDLMDRSAKGDYLDLSVRNLGLASRVVTLDGGRQGLFEFGLLFQGIPYNQYGDAMTPFVGVGGPNLGLPSNWVTGGSTSQMSALPAALQGVGIRRQRQIVGLDFKILPPQTHWSADMSFRHDRQSGTQITGANFLTTSSQLPAPIDYDTDQINAGVQYQRRVWQMRFSYYGSFFHDADSALTWSNPFTPYNSGATVGRMSVAPANAFSQISLSGAWQILPATRLMASASQGAAVQNVGFIPSTINPDVQAAPLPGPSLDGHINTGNYIVRLNSSPFRRLSLTAEYVEDRRDNKTAQAAYQQVETDVATTTTRVNLPYSFDRANMRFLADYRFQRLFKLEGGAAEQRFDRSYQEVARTYTTSEWGEVTSSFAANYGFSAKYLRSRRTIENYQAVPQLPVPENPLLRKFDLANRLREQELASAFYNPIPTLSLGMSFEHDDDNYYGSPVGLTYDKDYYLNVTGNWTPTSNASVYTYLMRQLMWAEQAGSQGGSGADWIGHTSQRVDGVGIGGQWKGVLPKTDVGADGNFSYTEEDTSVSYLIPTPGFPDNAVHDVGLRLYSRYHLSPKSSVRFDYEHERFLSSDWALDNVGPATLPNVLSLGVDSPAYRVNLFALSYRYEF